MSPDEIPDVTKALPSYITQFELAAQRLGNRDFLKALYQSLYQRMECKHHLEEIPRKYEEQTAWSGWSDVLKLFQSNKTLETVGDLLIATGDEPRRNPQIHAVLTFNADNLLELYCEAKTGGKRVVNMIDRASVGDHPDQTPVYHLHGTLDARCENFLRNAPLSVKNDELQEITDDLLPDIVFRESEYYETIANPASFVNHTPQSFLRRSNALFIGTSLDDLNMRRWLHDSFRERVQHRRNYLREFYWRQYGDADDEARLESLRHFWLRTETEGDQDKTRAVPKAHVDKVMKNLGVQVIWCRDYADIQKCLRDVRQQGHNPEFGRRVAEYPS
jgi:SIR2-like domain